MESVNSNSNSNSQKTQIINEQILQDQPPTHGPAPIKKQVSTQIPIWARMLMEFALLIIIICAITYILYKNFKVKIENAESETENLRKSSAQLKSELHNTEIKYNELSKKYTATNPFTKSVIPMSENSYEYDPNVENKDVGREKHKNSKQALKEMMNKKRETVQDMLDSQDKSREETARKRVERDMQEVRSNTGIDDNNDLESELENIISK